MHCTTSVAAAALLFALIDAGLAQTYPSRPITMINPFPAGGATDLLARTLIEHMRVSLGQPIVLENVSGAGGSIGIGRAVRAPADGYTLSFGNWASHVGSGAIYGVNYDVLNDLEPVALLATAPLWIVGRNTLPPVDMKELIGWLHSRPAQALAATVGIG